jgi:hypothetical protein
MSFQAYLDSIEKKTGLTPQQLLDEAAGHGFGPQTRSTAVIDWLAADHGLGRGHAMAIYHVIKNGPTISDTHVGSAGAHRDESTQLRLDGLAARAATTAGRQTTTRSRS